SSHINISSTHDLLVEGNITVPNGGDVSLTSSSGSVLGNGTAAIFNDDLNIDAAGDATGILVEGGPDPVNVHAGGNISVTAIQGGVDRSLTVDQIISTNGYVKLVAPDGINVVNTGTSLIQGESIELDATSGSIGGSGTIRIDSNILNDGHGGLSAVADGNINLREINGDLILIEAQGSLLPAVQAGGNVTLEAHSGSILDGIHELPVLANSNPLTPQQQLLADQLNGLAPISYTSSENVYTATFSGPSDDLVLDLGSSELHTGDAVVYHLSDKVVYSATPTTQGSALVFDLGSNALQTGDAVVYHYNSSAGTKNPIGGLAEGHTYYAVSLGSGMYALALTAADAILSTPNVITLT
ncbi:MAG TPA: hypothetical protein VKD22_10235, partial [Ramlibacter sp.]|nr:hypothetical protein [Ramlibacter sp.]